MFRRMKFYSKFDILIQHFDTDLNISLSLEKHWLTCGGRMTLGSVGGTGFRRQLGLHLLCTIRTGLATHELSRPTERLERGRCSVSLAPASPPLCLISK